MYLFFIMNILFLTTHLNIGGISSYILSLSAGLRKRGHSLFVASSGGELEGSLQAEGVICLRIPINTKSEINLPKLIRSCRILRPFIAEHTIGLLHSHTRVTQVLGCLAGRYSRIPHVSTCHGFFKNRLSRRMFPCWGERVIAVSGSVQEHLAHDFCLDVKMIRLVYNGIDADRFAPCAALSPEKKTEKKKAAGLPESPVVGIVARLSDVKGHRFLIEAMSIAVKKIPAAHLLIVGDGKMRADLKSLVASLGIQKNVSFVPSVQDTVTLLSCMDVFVMPSLKEGLGLSLMEAMACGLPVIGSDIGGIRNLIRDHENGLLVNPEDSHALSEAILVLLADKVKAALLGKNAKDFINREFSLEKMAEQTEAVYREVYREI
ncbi:MAG: glycosyltransferase family 4 protein [Candidatus Omnitrophota bacterium]|jgi:glycosyltransferase involved in cell wall biosynthesis